MGGDGAAVCQQHSCVQTAVGTDNGSFIDKLQHPATTVIGVLR